MDEYHQCASIGYGQRVNADLKEKVVSFVRLVAVVGIGGSSSLKRSAGEGR